MPYDDQDWNNNDPQTPINASRLEHMEAGIVAAIEAAEAAQERADEAYALAEAGGGEGGGSGDALKSETVRVVVHGTNAGTTRPSGYAAIYWIGSVYPNNILLGTDIWNDGA